MLDKIMTCRVQYDMVELTLSFVEKIARHKVTRTHLMTVARFEAKKKTEPSGSPFYGGDVELLVRGAVHVVDLYELCVSCYPAC